jgi:hypothetical protein
MSSSRTGFYFFTAAQKSKQKTSPAHWAPSPSGEGKEENINVFSADVDKKLKNIFVSLKASKLTPSKYAGAQTRTLFNRYTSSVFLTHFIQGGKSGRRGFVLY